MKKKRGVKKPKKKSMGRAYHWLEVVDFVQQKYGVNLHNELWHWWSEYSVPHNGSFMWLCFPDYIDNPGTAKHVRDALAIIKKEFAPKRHELKLWVEW